MGDIVLITSNVGSLFGEKIGLRENWYTEILKVVEKQHAKFIAINFQETGGKSFKIYSKDVPGLIATLHERINSLQHNSTYYCRAFLDLDYERVEEYTALSSIFFIHSEAINAIEQYNFRTGKFVKIVSENEVLLKSNLLNCSWVRSSKFGHDLWKAFRWSRKGFLHTRWRLDNSKIIDLINIHLFHDESNLQAFENPTQYRTNRQKALNYTLKSFMEWSQSKPSNLFILGDFNFRLNLNMVIKKLTDGCSQRIVNETPNHLSVNVILQPGSSSEGDTQTGDHSHDDSNLTTDGTDNDTSYATKNVENEKKEKNKNVIVEYCRNNSTDIILRLGKKLFDYSNADGLVHNWSELQQHDCELNLSEFTEKLYEAPINFTPTYPWSEDPIRPDVLMKTRAPAWCDRILMNTIAWNNLYQNNSAVNSNNASIVYKSLATNCCVGDHKVHLRFEKFNSFF